MIIYAYTQFSNRKVTQKTSNIHPQNNSNLIHPGYD